MATSGAHPFGSYSPETVANTAMRSDNPQVTIDANTPPTAKPVASTRSGSMHVVASTSSSTSATKATSSVQPSVST